MGTPDRWLLPPGGGLVVRRCGRAGLPHSVTHCRWISDGHAQNSARQSRKTPGPEGPRMGGFEVLLRTGGRRFRKGVVQAVPFRQGSLYGKFVSELYGKCEGNAKNL